MFLFKGEKISKGADFNANICVKHKCHVQFFRTANIFKGLLEKDAYTLYVDLNGFRSHKGIYTKI